MELIQDVIDDFNASMIEEKRKILNRDDISEILEYSYEINRLNVLDIKYQYSVLMFICHCVESFSSGDNVDVTEMEIFSGSLYSEMDKILSLSEQFKWAPRVVKRASLLGHEIFALAQQSYIKYDDGRLKKAEKLLKKVKSLEVGLDIEGFKYNTKEEVHRIYRNELEECILDLNIIRGDYLKLSQRMEGYIDGLDSK